MENTKKNNSNDLVMKIGYTKVGMALSLRKLLKQKIDEFETNVEVENNNMYSICDGNMYGIAWANPVLTKDKVVIKEWKEQFVKDMKKKYSAEIVINSDGILIMYINPSHLGMLITEQLYI